MVKRVEGYQTEDGSFFGSEQEARDHEAHCSLRQFVKDAGLAGAEDEEIMATLWRHRDRLLEILDGTSIPAREIAGMS